MKPTIVAQFAATVSRRFRLLAIAIGTTFFVSTALHAIGVAPGHTLTGLHVIELRMGDNHLARFAPDGRPAHIVKAWRGNGNAHSYIIYLVAMPGGEDATDWNVVDIESPKELPRDVVVEEPYDGEQYLHSIRFAHGLIDGKPETLLLSARRDIKDTFGDRVNVTYEVYKLVHDADSVGTRDSFDLVETWRSADRYCNSELAMSRQFGIPLGNDAPLSDSKDGCP